jgi:hypothetical protein
MEQVRRDPGLVARLPSTDAAIVNDALADRSVHEIANRCHVSESYVWVLLSNAARAASGHPRRTETAGLGSDTDPGVTGGYGDTGFGSLGAEPPIANVEEPTEGEETD